MNKNPGWTWRLRAQIIAVPTFMLIGLVFRILGKIPFDLNNLWAPNIPLLWIAVAAFVIAVALSYTVLPLVKRKNVSADQGTSSLWYENSNVMRMSWLAYGVLLPGLCIMEIFQILAITSRIDLFSWLAGAVFLIAIIADIVGLVLLVKGFRQRARA